MVLEGFDAKWWYEHNLREDMATNSSTMCRTTFQKICEVIKFRAHLAATQGAAASSLKHIAEQYKAKARMSKDSEAVTDKFLACAFKTEEVVFSSPVMLECLRDLEARYGGASPLNGFTKLQAILTMCRTRHATEWVICGFHDWIVRMAGTVTLGVRDLTQNKCYIQSFLLKQQFLGHVLSLAATLVPANMVRDMREVFETFQTYRLRMRPLPGQAAADLAYQAEWPQSARMISLFIEDTVFKNDPPYASVFHVMGKYGKNSEDTLAYGAVGEAWTSIKAVVDDEVRLAKVAQAGDKPEGAEGGGPADPEADARSGADAGFGADAAAADIAGGPSGVAADAGNPMARWKAYARDLVEARCTLKVITTGEDVLALELGASNVAKVVVVPGSNNILVHYDVKLAAEANSRPSSRKAPLRELHMRTCMKAALRVFANPARSMVKPGVLYLFHDQGRTGANTFNALFKNDPADKVIAPGIVYRKLAIVRDQDCHASRLGWRGFAWVWEFGDWSRRQQVGRSAMAVT